MLRVLLMADTGNFNNLATLLSLQRFLFNIKYLTFAELPMENSFLFSCLEQFFTWSQALKIFLSQWQYYLLCPEKLSFTRFLKTKYELFSSKKVARWEFIFSKNYNLWKIISACRRFFFFTSKQTRRKKKRGKNSHGCKR